MSTSCFLPCRKGSERVPLKNIKPFAGVKCGLVEVKLRQLLGSSIIDEIVLSTNDNEILDFADSLGSKKIRLHKREEALCTSNTSTDELVAHAFELIPQGHILWTHVTSPFVTADIYDQIIAKYFEILEEGYDSLMSTTQVHGFLWNDSGPINYDRTIERWPRTQKLEALHEVNSAAFLTHSNHYKNLNDRIGKKPYLHPLDKITSFDIDWPEDFAIAECIASSGLSKL